MNKVRLFIIMMCYVESRCCPFTVMANKTKLRKARVTRLFEKPTSDSSNNNCLNSFSCKVLM